MRKTFVALLLLTGAVAALASTAFARMEELNGGNEPAKLVNSQMNKELRTAVARPGLSGPGDTTYIGFVPGKVTATNYWGIGTGNYRVYSTAVADYGYWGFDNDEIHDNITEAHGDSLFGWWPERNLYTSTGGLTLDDYDRPWWATDMGNNANYKIGVGNFRTTGVVGVFHRDDGSASGGGVTWAPLGDSYSAWCGLRRDGDLAFTDDETDNPFNYRVLMNGNSIAGGGQVGGGIGTNVKFPGYAGQWDQMLYRDVNVEGASSIQVRFKFRTNMSTGYGTAVGTRTGWFNKDPLAPTGGAGGDGVENFISSSLAGLGAPIDSFMVYVGGPVGFASGSSWIGSDGATRTIYDPARRWFSEVLRVMEPGVSPYYEVFTTYGDNAYPYDASYNGVGLSAPIDADWGGKARIVFRNKTNRGFDDEGGSVPGAYSSGGAGAVVVDDVEYALDGGGWTSLGTFETAGEIDNDTAIDPLDAWKSTGKPMAVVDHVRDATDLVYEDLCGPVGGPIRICNLTGQVISNGDFDNSEAAGGTYGTAWQELMNGVESPTINFRNGGGTNEMGITAAIATATEDYYLSYEMYTGIYDFVNQGNAWRFGFRAYPGKQSDGTLMWSDRRYYGFIIFNPDKQCFFDWEPSTGLLRWSSADAEGGAVYPDSVRMYIGKLQQCFRFGVPSSSCSPTDGSYMDNLTLMPVDGSPSPILVDIWQLINDTFTVNGGDNRAQVPPGSPAFDTTTALPKIGLNVSQTTNTNDRYTIPGDTMTINADGDDMRMDLVFRINPGPGNYTAIGDNSTSLRLVPTAATACDISAPQTSPANFWEQYLLDNGTYGTPAGHPASGLNGGATWSNLVWNSARMDTTELNLWCIDTRGIGLPFIGTWSSMYSELDPKFGVLGIDKNRCFLLTATAAVTQANTTCNLVTNPTDGWEATAGYVAEGSLTYGHTYEFTKILPDGQFTPGTHVQYFFRREDASGSGGPCEAAPCHAPDTNIVFPQALEGSTDAHRWQQFSVLPDAWKFDAYDGLGQACLLYIDANDRRGNERVWVSIADSTNATAAAKYGAHNGWHAPGTGNDAVNDEANFVRNLNEQPGTTWDMFGHKASESLNSRAGTIGAWNSNHAASAADYKWSYLGPSIGMLEAYYKVLLLHSGDLNSTILGPGLNYSNNDTQMLQDFLNGGTSGDERGLMIDGDGFVEANGSGPQLALMTDWLKVSLRDPSYLALTQNGAACMDIVPSAPIATTEIYGVTNACTYTNDVLTVEAGGAEAARYEPAGIATPNVVSSVYHAPSGSEFYRSLVDGWDVEHLRSRFCTSDAIGRLWYYSRALVNIFGSICTIAGSPTMTDVPNGGAQHFVDFMNLRNNPLVAGEATVDFGLSKPDRVEVKVFDVSGRLVRTLADRQFAPGKWSLKWDGVDNNGRQVARGVYFTQVKYVNRKFTDARKLTVLK
jgi:hypothetical protein